MLDSYTRELHELLRGIYGSYVQRVNGVYTQFKRAPQKRNLIQLQEKIYFYLLATKGIG